MHKINLNKLITLISLIIILIALQLYYSFIESQQSLSAPIVIYGESRTDHQTHQKIVDERWYSVEKDNLHFIVYNQARTSPYSQLFIKAYHFCKLFIINNQLIIDVYNIDSNLIDRFTVNFTVN